MSANYASYSAHSQVKMLSANNGNMSSVNRFYGVEQSEEFEIMAYDKKVEEERL